MFCLCVSRHVVTSTHLAQTDSELSLLQGELVLVHRPRPDGRVLITQESSGQTGLFHCGVFQSLEKLSWLCSIGNMADMQNKTSTDVQRLLLPNEESFYFCPEWIWACGGQIIWKYILLWLPYLVHVCYTCTIIGFLHKNPSDECSLMSAFLKPHKENTLTLNYRNLNGNKQWNIGSIYAVIKYTSIPLGIQWFTTWNLLSKEEKTAICKKNTRFWWGVHISEKKLNYVSLMKLIIVTGSCWTPPNCIGVMTHFPLYPYIIDISTNLWFVAGIKGSESGVTTEKWASSMSWLGLRMISNWDACRATQKWTFQDMRKVHRTQKSWLQSFILMHNTIISL